MAHKSSGVQAMDALVDTLASLEQACSMAGGTAPSLNSLKMLTAMELVQTLASNNIRFLYSPIAGAADVR